MITVKQASPSPQCLILAIAVCLRSSRLMELRRLGGEGGESAEEGVQTVLRLKKISADDHSFVARLRPSLLQITSLNSLRAEVEQLRVERYSQENPKHEKMLLKLWSLLMPDSPLEDRVTQQWGDIGFQGNNPATDFRGMGGLGLHCLLYFSSTHTGQARSVLTSSQHPVIGYPFAVVGINLTQLLYQWLQEGVLDHHYYSLVTDRPLKIEDFLESFCYVFHRFNGHWVEEQPENVMAFPAVKDQFAAQLRAEITSETPTVMLVDKK